MREMRSERNEGDQRKPEISEDYEMKICVENYSLRRAFPFCKEMLNNQKSKMRLFSGKYHSYYLVILLAVVAALIVTTIVLAYFSSSSTNVKLGSNVIRISSKAGQMEYPDIAINPVGDTIVAWQDKSVDNYDIFAQYFDRVGDPIGMPFVVNQFKLNDQKYPKIAVDGEGDFVIIWQSYKQDGSGSGIYGQRFSKNGKKVGSEFRVNTYIMDSQTNPDIAMNKQGNFVVIWEGERSQNNFKHKSIYAQRFNADGEMVGKEFRVNETLNAIQDNPVIGIDDNNNFVIVWQSVKGEDLDIYGHKYNWNEKTVIGSDIIINTTTKFDQKNPAITNVGSNKFIVIWQHDSQHEFFESMLDNLKGQMLSTGGQKSGGEIEITVPMFGHQESPDLSQSSSTKIFIVWQNYDKLSENQNWNIFGQILTISGALDGDPFLISSNDDELNQKPAISSNSKGHVGITWTSLKKDKKLVNFISEVQS